MGRVTRDLTAAHKRAKSDARVCCARNGKCGRKIRRIDVDIARPSDEDGVAARLNGNVDGVHGRVVVHNRGALCHHVNNICNVVEFHVKDRRCELRRARESDTADTRLLVAQSARLCMAHTDTDVRTE